MIQLKDFDIILDIKNKKVKYRDTISGKFINEIEVIKGDYKSTRLNFYLEDGEKSYPINTNEVEVVFKKHDNTVVVMDKTSEGFSIEDNVIKTILSTNITAISGRQVKGEVVIKGINGEVLTSMANFYFRVQRGILTDKAIQSTNELPLLNRLVEQVNILDKTLTDNEISRDEVFRSIVDTSGTTKTGLDQSIINGESIKSGLDSSIDTANTIKNGLDNSIEQGNPLKTTLQELVDGAVAKNILLSNTVDDAIVKNTELSGVITTANNKKSELDTSIQNGTNTKTALDESIQVGGAVFEDVDMLKGLRIYKGNIQPTDTPFWYDSADNTGITRR